MIRIIVVDDHTIVRDGLAALLDEEEDMQLVGRATDLSSLQALMETGVTSDVLVLDFELPDGSGEEGLRALLKLKDRPAVVFYTMHSPGPRTARVLDAGAYAWVTKTEPVEHLTQAIRAAAAGETWLPPEVAEAVTRARTGPRVRLSPREREVLRRLAEGASPSEIGHQLGLAPSTVSTHLRSLREKVGARSNGDLVRQCLSGAFGEA